MLRWTERHKTRMGDRARGHQKFMPQCSMGIGEALEEALAEGNQEGPLYPEVTPEAITRWLRRHITSDDEDMEVSAHGIRAGTDVALQAVGVPEDVVAAWGWWARMRRMTGYYGAISVLMAITIAALILQVEVVTEAPGWYRPVSLPPIPNWATLRTRGPAVPDHPPTAWEAEDGESEEDEEERPVVGAKAGELRGLMENTKSTARQRRQGA